MKGHQSPQDEKGNGVWVLVVILVYLGVCAYLMSVANHAAR